MRRSADDGHKDSLGAFQSGSLGGHPAVVCRSYQERKKARCSTTGNNAEHRCVQSPLRDATLRKDVSHILLGPVRVSVLDDNSVQLFVKDGKFFVSMAVM